jgi:hypothetical protein
MEEEVKPDEPKETLVKRTRPLFLTVLCLFSFVYFGLLSLLYLAGLFNSGWITSVTNQYLPTGNISNAQTLFIFMAGFSLHCLSFTGILLIWNLRKTGYYFLGLSCLVIAAFQLFNPLTAITSIAIYIILVFLFGIFYKRLH